MTAIAPGATIGVLGGGQLGKMLALEAVRMGYRVRVLDPDPACPAAGLAEVELGAWSDPEAAVRLARQCDVVTLETEHVPATVLREVEKVQKLRPSAHILETIQDRLNQRQFLQAHMLPQTQWQPVANQLELEKAVEILGVPAILKRRHGGYDGRAQVRILNPIDVENALQTLGNAPCVLEAFVHFSAELSVVLARSQHGEICYYETAENVHHGGVLHTTVAPARLPHHVRTQAREIATSAAHALDITGILTVEFFLLPDQTLLINEMAPRVHNSGHFTFGACVTSQFEQHLRAVCGLPLGTPNQHHPAAMLNLLGDLWVNGPPDFLPVLAEPRAHLHLYGKRVPGPGRKMGHITVLADEAGEALAVAERLYRQLLPKVP